MKQWVASVYQSNTFNSLLKDALHPGGGAMTRRLLEVASIKPNSTVLDIACGKGSTPILIGQEVTRRVIGIDLSPQTISLAHQRSRAETPSQNLEFIVADAEELPFQDATFDTVISECSFSLLPNKTRAASEISRVLKSQGNLVMTDITLREGTPEKLPGDLSSIESGRSLLPCLCGARPIADYVAIFEQAGFEQPHVEDHSAALGKVAYQIVVNFGSWAGFLSQLSSELLPDSGPRETARVSARQTLLTPRKFGYALFMFSKR